MKKDFSLILMKQLEGVKAKNEILVYLLASYFNLNTDFVPLGIRLQCYDLDIVDVHQKMIIPLFQGKTKK